MDAERLRLLYVAGTRAKDLLVVCRSGQGGNKAWAEFEHFLVGAPEMAVPDAEAPTKAVQDVSPKARALATAARQAARDRLLAASWDVTSVTTAKGKEDGDAKADKAHGDGETAASSAATTAWRLDAGPAWGTLIHGLLEHAGRHRDATRADLERLARWLTVETPQLRPAIADALDVVEKVRNAPFWAEARAGGEVHVEVPFAVRIAAGQALGRVVASSRRPTVSGA